MHRLAIAFIRWAARLNRLQSHLLQRNILNMQSAAGRAVLVELTQQVFGSLPVLKVRDYSDVMSLKLRNYFNLNLELPPTIAPTALALSPEWHANPAQTKRVAVQLVHLETQYHARCQAVETALAHYKIKLACQWQQAHAMLTAGITSGGLMATLAQYVHGQADQSWKSIEDSIQQASQRHSGKRNRAAAVFKAMADLDLHPDADSQLPQDPVSQLPTGLQVELDDLITYGPQPKHACIMELVAHAKVDLNYRARTAQRTKALRAALQSVQAWSEGSLTYRSFVLGLPTVAKALADTTCPLATVLVHAQAMIAQYPSRAEAVQFYLSAVVC